MAAFDEKSALKIIFNEDVVKPEWGPFPRCVISYPGRKSNQYRLEFHFEIVNELIVGFRYDPVMGIQIPIRLHNAGDFLYYLAKIFDWCHEKNTIFRIENQVPKVSKWSPFIPNPGLYIFSSPCATGKLVPYIPLDMQYGPQNLEDEEEKKLNDDDDCKKYHAIFYNVRLSSSAAFKLRFHTGIPEREYRFHNHCTLDDNKHGSTPKTFEKFLAMICFEYHVPDGSLFFFADALDDDSVFRKMLPKKAKFHLDKGIIEVIEKFQ